MLYPFLKVAFLTFYNLYRTGNNIIALYFSIYFEDCHHLVMVNRVEEFRKVDVHYPVMSVIHHFQCFNDCLLCTSVGSEPIAVVVKLLLEYRSEHLRYRLLYEAVNYGWYSKVSYTAVRLRYLHPADRLRLIFSRPQLLPDVFAVFRKVIAEFVYGHAVNSRRTFVPYDLQIRRIEIIFA